MRAARLAGLDLARAWALLGMLVVNFRVAMGVDKDPDAPVWLQGAVEALSGRAAALFVVLAGMGLALATSKLHGGELWNWITRRALFRPPWAA
ncbi:MAG: heparan-alpha-glucosaminide N-acetyltransferase domain-containing protein [Burkholderiaceae bacterium]